MTEPRIAPYGSWASPITSDLIVASSIGLGDILVDEGDIYWIESRPLERGRTGGRHRPCQAETSKWLGPAAWR